MTVGQLVTSAAAILAVGVGAFWALASWTSAGLRDDVSAMRTSLATLQGSDKDNAVNIKQAELDFTRQIGALNVTLATFGGKVDQVNTAIADLSQQIHGYQKQVSFSQRSGVEPKDFIEMLRKAGIDGKNIIVVPYPAALPPAN